ncbi:hypothetical protein BGX29_010938 [Mortierella sp. GBA35]|nr:hypothetical protein BGX29_010938 [Mortierella sp. GBA35]
MIMDKGKQRTLFAFGSNGNGQLGIASDDDTSIPIPVIHFTTTTAAAAESTTSSTLQLHHQHEHHNDPNTGVNAITPFHEFAAGGNHTALITHGSRQLFMTGSNKDGETLLKEPSQVFKSHDLSEIFLPQSVQWQQLQLNNEQGQGQGQGKGQEQGKDKDYNSSNGIRWRSVACGWAFTIAITEPYPTPYCHTTTNTSNNNQIVYAWGSGSFGELGLGPGRSKTGRQAIAITTGLLDTSNSNSNRSNNRFELVKVRAGLRHVLLLAKETTRSHGQDAVEESATTRTVLMGWGSNRQGQLGVLTQSESAAPLTEKELRGKFMEPTRIVISASRNNRLATATETNDGHDNSEPEILDMACGQNHSMVLFSNGAVYSSGLDKYGQLGPRSVTEKEAAEMESKKTEFRIGFEQVRGLPFVDSISCGWNHNAAMDTRPFADPTAVTTIYLWGRNDHGQLGGEVPLRALDVGLNGAIGHIPTGITQVRIPARRKDGAVDEGGEVAYEPLVSYSCGSEHTLAMTQSGACYAWGWNEHGNCGGGLDSDGNRDVQDVPIPRLVQFPTTTTTTTTSTTLSSSSSSGQGWVTGGYGSSWVWT